MWLAKPPGCLTLDVPVLQPSSKRTGTGQGKDRSATPVRKTHLMEVSLSRSTDPARARVLEEVCFTGPVLTSGRDHAKRAVRPGLCSGCLRGVVDTCNVYIYYPCVHRRHINAVPLHEKLNDDDDDCVEKRTHRLSCADTFSNHCLVRISKRSVSALLPVVLATLCCTARLQEVGSWRRETRPVPRRLPKPWFPTL